MNAILIKDVSFYYIDNKLVEFKAGQPIKLDVKELIAYLDGYHFEISLDEVAFLQ